jgi:hypothetical protein
MHRQSERIGYQLTNRSGTFSDGKRDMHATRAAPGRVSCAVSTLNLSVSLQGPFLLFQSAIVDVTKLNSLLLGRAVTVRWDHPVCSRGSWDTNCIVVVYTVESKSLHSMFKRLK